VPSQAIASAHLQDRRLAVSWPIILASGLEPHPGNQLNLMAFDTEAYNECSSEKSSDERLKLVLDRLLDQLGFDLRWLLDLLCRRIRISPRRRPRMAP